MVSEECHQIAYKIAQYLRKANISGKVEEVIPGPVVTRYTFEPYVGTLIKDIFAIVPDIELITESSNVRVSHIQNSSLIAIDVPNVASMNEVAINTANVFEELMNHTLTPEKLKNFIDAGIWINSCNSDGMSLLTILCLRDNIEMAEILIQAGADVNMPNKLDGRTPIFWGNADICRLLIKYGANPNYKACGWQTALFHSGNDIEKTKLLVENGADVNSKDPLTGWTVLHSVEDADCARILIQNGASINIDNDRGAALISEHMDKPGVLRVLIENGAVITKDSPLAKLVMDEELLTLVRKSIT